MTTIKDIIEKFDKEFPEPGGMCQQCELEGSFCDYCKEERQNVKQFISASLAELLDSILKKLPEQEECVSRAGDCGVCYNCFYNKCQRDVINIINSHR